jgi:hypothetical protein
VKYFDSVRKKLESKVESEETLRTVEMPFQVAWPKSSCERRESARERREIEIEQEDRAKHFV